MLSHEIGNALLGLDESALRADAIELLLGARLPRGKDFVWPTTSGDSKPGLHALCNGAPGVALAALLGARYSGDERYVPLIEAAMSTVAVRSQNDSFCCGTLGRVEVLIEAHRTTNEPHLLSTARDIFHQVDPNGFTEAGWQRGSAGYAFTSVRLEDPLGVDLPGLPLSIVPMEPSVA